RRGDHAVQLAEHVEPAALPDPRRTASGPDHLPGPGDQRRTGHRGVPVRRPAHLRRPGRHGQDPGRHRHRPLLHHPRRPQRTGRRHRTVDRPAVALSANRRRHCPGMLRGDMSGVNSRSALRVLAHFRPGPKVLEFLEPESGWLDVRFCDEDDDETFHRELPHAEVIWHVLRPLSGEDLTRATRCRLVHKLGTGVNTIDVDTATERGIAVANMPGANAASVAEGTVMLMLAALRRLVELDRATRAGTGWPTDPSLGETV